MTSQGKKVLWIIIVIAIILIVVAISKNNNSNQTKSNNETIKIGFIGPMSGDAASYGEIISRGAQIAAQDINSSGGINGKKIEIVIADSKCNGPGAVTALQRLIDIDGIKYFIAGICSSETISMAPIIEKNKLVGISPSATSPAISGISKYVFRNAPSDAARGTEIANLLMKSYKKPAIISANTDYSKGLRDTFVNTLKESNIKVVADEIYNPDSRDFRSILTKVKNAQPDAIFMNPQTPADMIRLSNQAFEIGLKAQLYAAEFNDKEVASAKGVSGTIVAVAPNITNDPDGLTVIKKYKEQFKIDAEYPYYVAASYDIVKIFAEALKNTNTEDGDGVRDYISDLNNYKGSIGTYSFDDKGDITGIKFIFQKNVDGKFIDL